MRSYIVFSSSVEKDFHKPSSSKFSIFRAQDWAFFLDRNASVTNNIFTTVQEYPESNYNNERDGGSLSVSYNIGEYGSQSIGYTLEKRNIVAEDKAASSIKSIAGENILSLVSLGNSIDKTDNKFDPSEGWRVSNKISIAGIGGDKKYFRGTQSFSTYDEIFDDNIIGSLSARIGYVVGFNQNIDISDRFTLGGNSFVGFQTAGIGPRDKNTSDALGGNFYYTITPQVKFGLGLPKELGIKGRVQRWKKKKIFNESK